MSDYRSKVGCYLNIMIFCILFITIGLFLGLSLKINSQSYWSGWNDGTTYLMDLGTIGSCSMEWAQKETPKYCDCLEYARFKPERYSICRAWRSCELGEECSLFWGVNPMSWYK